MNNRVFIVDDDHAILELMSSLLETEGYQVESFDSARAALRAASSRTPDVMIVDLMMPEMDGCELIREIRGSERTQNVPVVVCSAYYGDLRRCALEVGGDNLALLRKPFHIDSLLDAVARMSTRPPSIPVEGRELVA